jgi:hypothetical protein
VAAGPQHSHDFTVLAFDHRDPGGTIDDAGWIAVREKLPPAVIRDGTGDTSVPHWRFSICTEQQEHEISAPYPTLSRPSSGMGAKPTILD